MKIFSSILILVLVSVQVLGQIDGQIDSSKVKKEGNKGFLSIFEEPPGLKPSPRRAMLLSLALPGAGQVYNQKQWYIRAPIAAGLVSGGTYYYITFRSEYLYYRNNLRLMVQNLPNAFTGNPNASESAVRNVRDEKRQRMEQALFGTIGVYLLQGIEAFSTAHLLNFDVSEDLSFDFEPTFENTGMGTTMGFGVTIQPKIATPQPIDWLMER